MGEWKRIDHVRCDLCPKVAQWEHPKGGKRCATCPRPEAEPEEIPAGLLQPYRGTQMVILERRHPNGTLDLKGKQPPSVRGQYSPGVMTFDEVYGLYFRDNPESGASACWPELEAWLKKKGWTIRAKTW